VTVKLQTIHEMFLALSNELKTTKEKLLTEKQAARAMRERMPECDVFMLQIENHKKHISQLKHRIKELIADNAEYVPPARFEEVLTRATDLELENDQLRESVDVKQTEIERQSTLIKELTRNVQKAQLRHDADLKELQRMEAASEEKISEIAVLRAKLQDRTKNLLALERMSACKPAGVFGGPYPDVECDNEDPCICIPKINPLFLRSESSVVE
jgi:DNA repair exonuclease SbcCD ATPase subunit